MPRHRKGSVGPHSAQSSQVPRCVDAKPPCRTTHLRGSSHESNRPERLCMRLIERYLFRQLLGPTLLATAALVALALLARSLSEFDVLVEQRQSALVFLKIIVLALPQLF